MKKYFTVVLLVTLSGILTPTYGQWQPHIIDNDINLAVSVDTADLDGDTKLDLIVTNYYGNELIWYQNNFPNWNKHIIDTVPPATFAYSGDMDGDDDLDVVASLYSVRKLVWYENNLPDTIWTQHIIENLTKWSDYLTIADIDNDDTLDVVTAVTTGYYGHVGDIVWYENNVPDPIWTQHIIEPYSNGTPAVAVNDIDGDGILDVVATFDLANKVVWYKTTDNGLSWTKYTIDYRLNHAFGLNSGYIDGDDKVDLVATTGGPYFSESDVVWYKNNLPDTNWTKHIIDSNLPGATWPYVADVDGDDTMDVIADGFYGDVVWYENNHPYWAKDTIATNLNQIRLYAVTDVDGDKMIDVIVPALDRVVWYENPILTLPAAPILIEPENNAILSSDTVQFVWHKSYPEVTKYWFEIDTTDQFSAPAFSDSTITDTTLLYTSLIDGEYWWRVKAFNSLGWGDFSEVRTFEAIITSVEEDNQLPTVFSMEQNFPNPFNPVTRIKYQIPELSFVTLKVYDVLGSEVAILINEEKPIGTYELTWYAESLPSGVYFYQLNAGEFINTKKMMLLK